MEQQDQPGTIADFLALLIVALVVTAADAEIKRLAPVAVRPTMRQRIAAQWNALFCPSRAAPRAPKA